MKRIAATLALAAIVLSIGVSPAIAGGDQVNRPDGSGYFEDGLHAEGDSPFAGRAQQTCESRP